MSRRRAAQVHRACTERLRPRVGQERPNRFVQAIRLAQDDVHQVRLFLGELQLGAEHLNRPAHRRQRVADLVRDAGRHFTHRGQLLPLACLALQPPNRGHVLEGQEEASPPVGRDQVGGAEADVANLVLAGAVREIDPPGAVPGKVGLKQRHEVGGQLQHLARRAPGDRRALVSRDDFRGAIERDDAAGAIGRDQPARQALNDVLVEGLEVGQGMRRVRQARIDPPQAVGERPADQGDGNERNRIGGNGVFRARAPAAGSAACRPPTPPPRTRRCRNTARPRARRRRTR